MHWRFFSVLLLFYAVVSVTTAKKSRISPLRHKEAQIASEEKDDLEASEATFYSFPSWSSITGGLTWITQFPSNFLPSKPAPKPPKPVEQCDLFPPTCTKTRYRSYDGSCNNLFRPSWGQINSTYGRLLRSKYADGINAPPVAKSGRPLPPARLVSYIMFPDRHIEDPKYTLVAMQYGQIITHDMALISGTTQSIRHKTRCCTDDGDLMPTALSSPSCFPIIIPDDDPVYAPSGRKCMNFVRSQTDLDRGCSSPYEPADQITVVSHYLDLSLVYGPGGQASADLRAGVGGRLRVEVRSNREWMPSAPNKTAACDVQSEADICYLAGDSRVNQNPQLTILQLVLLREHNRVAGFLAKMNPFWNDETIFQEARRIVTAEHQHISYYEYLPIFLGTDNLYRHKVLYNTSNYVMDYDPSIDPSVINEHSTAAFRYFHSLIAGHLQLIDEDRGSFGSLRLSNFFNRPGIIEQNGNLDGLTRGMSFQREMENDRFFSKEITQFLFRNMRPVGRDLRAIDIQRGRDHGLNSYNAYRKYCGVGKARKWADFNDLISMDNIQKLAGLYESVDDVDLTVGASLEAHVPGTKVGPTFLCILTEQFYRTRVGDRFWYETGDRKTAFTIEQLNTIRQASISRLFCDNGDRIEFMQARGFEVVSQFNPLTSCDDLPEVDLSLWKDYAQVPFSTKSPYYLK